MTTFNTNYTGNLGARTLVGPTKIRSPTRYSDMFIGVEDDTIDRMVETGPESTVEPVRPPLRSPVSTPCRPLSRYDAMKKLARASIDKYGPLDVHYRVIDTVQEAMEAAAKLAEFHSISVMWEGFDVNRNGRLTWIICGYLGSAVLFNVREVGPKIFSEGGLKTLLEARHPIKVIHDCSCLADILYHQFGVQLDADSIFDTHAADLVIQSKSSNNLEAKTLVECLIEYQDIPIPVYRTWETIMKKDPSIWVWSNIPPELYLATARIARYAALLHGVMLKELSKPLPKLTEMYLNCRFQERSPDPHSRVREIPENVQSLLQAARVAPPILRTEWNIPQTVLNPVIETQPGDEHFYSKPFKFDPRKATVGSLKVFSVDPNRAPAEDDQDWEKWVQSAPLYNNKVESQYDDAEEDEGSDQSQPDQLDYGQHFKVPDIFSDVSTSACSTSSSSSGNVNVIVPKCELPPSLAATLDPTLMGTKIVWPGEGDYNNPTHHVPVMSEKLSALVEKIRKEQESNPQFDMRHANPCISAETMRRELEDKSVPDYAASSSDSISTELERINQREVIRVISPHYEIQSSSAGESEDVVIERDLGTIQPGPRSSIPVPVQTSRLTQQVPADRPATRPSSNENLRTFVTSPPSQATITSPRKILTSPSEGVNPKPVPPTVRSTSGRRQPPPLIDLSSTSLNSSVESLHIISAPAPGTVGQTSESASRDPSFSQTDNPSDLKHQSTPQKLKRPPLVIIPKYRGRGRSKPPPLAPISRPAHSLGSAPASRGRGRTQALADRTLVRDFLTDEERSSGTSRAGSLVGCDDYRASVNSDSLFHGDFYGPGVKIADSGASDSDVEDEDYPSSRASLPAVQPGRSRVSSSGNTSIKLPPVSMCFAPDSDDPDNF